MSRHRSNRQQIYTFILPLFIEILVVGIEAETFRGFALILGIHFAVWANPVHFSLPFFLNLWNGDNAALRFEMAGSAIAGQIPGQFQKPKGVSIPVT